MKLKSLLSVAAAAAACSASAQTWVADTITMGPTYAKDVYYSMGSGMVKEDSNSRWDLAFSALPASAMTNPHYGVGVWINSAVSSTGVPVSLYSIHKKVNGNFAGVTGADTIGKLTQPLINSEDNYGKGAFNTNGDGTMFNFGWGSYNQVTHNITGDSVYVAIRGGVAYKIWIEEYVSVAPTTWKFHVQKLDNSSPAVTTNINITANFANRVLAYYSFANGVIDREPAANTWDLNFTRYTAMVSMGGAPVPYPVAGVFINPYITVRPALKATADTSHYQNYVESSDLNVIGTSWKTTSFVNGAFILDTANYFVKSNNGLYYQLEFTYASLSASGKTAFRKRIIPVTTAVNTVNNTIAKFFIAPVPANNDFNMMVDVKEKAGIAMMVIADMAGRVVYNRSINIEQGVNAFNVNTSSFANGNYVLSLNGQSIKLSQKITVAH